MMAAGAKRTRASRLSTAGLVDTTVPETFKAHHMIKNQTDDKKKVKEMSTKNLRDICMFGLASLAGCRMADVAKTPLEPIQFIDGKDFASQSKISHSEDFQQRLPYSNRYRRPSSMGS
eukprot:m.118752 g.118752  ORF g.118752 m.118752 type:complete len:118 (+) comp14290_c0_seq3:143-496(+)